MPALDTQTKVAVVGAGAMGSGIAQVAAQAGHQVYLHDQREGAAEAGRDGIAKQLQRRVDKGKMHLGVFTGRAPDLEDLWREQCPDTYKKVFA